MQTQLNTLAPYLQQLKQKLRELIAKSENMNALEQEQRLHHEMTRDRLRQELQQTDRAEEDLPKVEINEEVIRQQVQELSLNADYWTQLLEREETSPLLAN